ncbi:unnamed protein product [Paramecium octaurelia]|uniref:Uncharacterized protein n=1 Tax=Paramecium octaurelia TaxID=43137 RepID=A0A8S1WKF4_PAROT|nr:unnamed protein product [Paramecium octaurelia]
MFSIVKKHILIWKMNLIWPFKFRIPIIELTFPYSNPLTPFMKSHQMNLYYQRKPHYFLLHQQETLSFKKSFIQNPKRLTFNFFKRIDSLDETIQLMQEPLIEIYKMKCQVHQILNINGSAIIYSIYNLVRQKENKIMEFPSRRIAEIFADSQNTTFVFFVKASKDNRWAVKEQLIVVTDLEIEEEFVLNQEIPQNAVNPNDEITILIRNNQKHAFVMQEFKILAFIKTTGCTVKFRLTGLTTNYNSPVYIYLVPGNESIAFHLNSPPSEVQFNIDPLLGESLDYFNYSMQNFQPENTFSIYYYFDKLTLQNDVNLQSVNNGIPLVINSQELTGSFQLPNGIIDDAISVLFQIESAMGSKSYLVQKMIRQINYANPSIIKLIFQICKVLITMTKLMEIEQQQVLVHASTKSANALQNIILMIAVEPQKSTIILAALFSMLCNNQLKFQQKMMMSLDYLANLYCIYPLQKIQIIQFQIQIAKKYQNNTFKILIQDQKKSCLSELLSN